MNNSNLPDGCTPQMIDDEMEGFYHYCPECGAEIEDEDICLECGAELSEEQDD